MRAKNNRINEVLKFVKDDLEGRDIDTYWLDDMIENCFNDLAGMDMNLYKMAREISDTVVKKLNSYAHQTAL